VIQNYNVEPKKPACVDFWRHSKRENSSIFSTLGRKPSTPRYQLDFGGVIGSHHSKSIQQQQQHCTNHYEGEPLEIVGRQQRTSNLTVSH
jgi:hypothetical protein